MTFENFRQMDGSRKHNPDPERQMLYVLSHKYLLDIMKTSLQFTIPENLDNNEDPKRDKHGSNLQLK